jgi:hypothetical protein
MIQRAPGQRAAAAFHGIRRSFRVQARIPSQLPRSRDGTRGSSAYPAVTRRRLAGSDVTESLPRARGRDPRARPVSSVSKEACTSGA